MSIDEGLRQEVIKHADIVKIISSFLSVVKKGKNYMCVCPFHDDTHPSMSISPERKMFKCFVCGTGGDAISFVQKYLHISYFEALKKVADLSDFHDPRLENRTEIRVNVDPKKETIIKCLADLTLYYQYALSTSEGEQGLVYLQSRFLDDKLRDKYKIGYAPKNGKNTIDFLLNRGHSIKTIEDAGISFLSNGEYKDRYQGRVVFPLFDKDGKVCGFSCRKIDPNEEGGKYVNTSSTYVFHKSEILYNFHIAKDKAKIADYVYVLEGFMDVLALARIGLDNAVAIMGTALTDEHIALLRTLNVEIRLCLDGDQAGQEATLKASKKLEQAGLRFSIIDNRNCSKDPDEILNEEGKESLLSYLQKTLSRIDFALQYYQNTSPLKTIESKKQLVKAFLPILSRNNSPFEVDNYLRKLSNITGFEYESIKELLQKYKEKTLFRNDEAFIDFHPERKLLRRLEFAEREFLYQMLFDPKAIEFYSKKIVGFYDEIYRSIASFLVNYASEHSSFDPIDLLSSIESSDIANKEELVKELTTLCFEKNHPNVGTPNYLENLYEAIQEEKENIFENDTLEALLEGKTELEKAKIIGEYNRRKLRRKVKGGK